MPTLADIMGALDTAGVDLGAVDLGDDMGARGGRRPANRKYILGLGNQVLGAAGAFSLQQAPNLDFRPLRLVLTETVANNFTMTSFKAGNVDQVIGVGGIPVSVFGPTAVGVTIEGQTVKANTPLVVAGTGAAAATIAGACIGLAAQ